MDIEKYRQIFLEESRERLEGMNRELLSLEADKEDYEGIDALFREAHSIKGMSASMGYGPLVDVSHAMEDILDGIRKNNIPVLPDTTALLFEGVDLLARLTDEVEEKGDVSFDVAGLVERLRVVGAGPPSPETVTPAEVVTLEEAVPEAEVVLVGEEAVPEAEIVESGEEVIPEAEIVEEATGDDPAGTEDRARILELSREGKVSYRCRISISRDTASLTARNFVLIGKLNKVGTVVRSVPSLKEVLEGKGREVVDALVATERPVEELRAQINTVPELEEITVERVAVESLGSPVEEREGKRGVTAPGRKEETPAEEHSRRDASRRLIEQNLSRKSTTVRVDTRVLDELINLVGEMIVSRDGLLDLSRDIGNEPLDLSLGRMDRLVRTLQDTIMAVRMMPIEIITDRLPRIVRDLSRMGGKDIRFEILGQGIELDRAILEEVNDVLIHLVRNAIDHGIESVDDRRAAGKPEKALVRLSAGREQDWVWISVEDDGRGMDVGKIREKALERGLLTPERAAAMIPREIFLLACLPGLSTAERVSDVSGRGVGMDVVKSRVDGLGGSLEIDSRAGEGTVVTLRLPLTLAIVQVLLVKVRGQIFGVPVSHVRHTMLVDPGQVEWSGQQAVTRWGKRVIPLVDLGFLAGLDRRDLRGGDPFPVVLTGQAEDCAGLVVDGLEGAFEAVIKPLGLPLKKISGLAGATVMGDGRIVLVLDVKGLR